MEQVNKHFDHTKKKLPELTAIKDEFKNFYTLDGTLIKSLIDIESDLKYLVACCDVFVTVKLEQAIHNYTKRDNI